MPDHQDRASDRAMLFADKPRSGPSLEWNCTEWLSAKSPVFGLTAEARHSNRNVMASTAAHSLVLPNSQGLGNQTAFRKVEECPFVGCGSKG